MGTAVSIDVRDAGVPAQALTELVDWLHVVDATFSTYKDDSAITRLGRGEATIEQLDPLVGEVLSLCEEVRIASGGAFAVDCVPAPNGTHLDPSGLVKGWSIERGAGILRRWGAENVCINAGGDVALRGSRDAGVPWRVGIRHPDQAGLLAAVVQGVGPLAVATSACYERGPHIVDPRTGRPADGLVSVTVIGADLTFADAYATAVFVMGLDGLAWLESTTGYQGFAITADAQTYSTSGFHHYC
ncbi:MAG: FAD:protein transferase [Acidimicrobiaceae bacterium]|nr:FAD:protein transferase [Acidimicrobiaceae bacterium]